MELTGNTILITGGGTGIGRGLAESFHNRGNKVIIAGRRESILKEVCAAKQGMEYVVLDVRNSAQVLSVRDRLVANFPQINCLINNAGVQRAVNFASDEIDMEAVDDEVGTNLSGLIHMCAAFLPHFRKQPKSAVINVSSGLGLTPLAKVPVYSATKAAVHSFTTTLRHQLRATTVEVIDLIPPSVATDLRVLRQEKAQAGPQPMLLEEYIAEVFKALESGEQEVAIGTAKRGIAMVSNEDTRKTFAMMNR